MARGSKVGDRVSFYFAGTPCEGEIVLIEKREAKIFDGKYFYRKDLKETKKLKDEI